MPLRIVQNYLFKLVRNPRAIIRIVQNYLIKLVRNPRAIIVKSDGQHVPCRCRIQLSYCTKTNTNK